MYSTKVEEELALHIKKAITNDETAPKQKHVRACIVYTWDLKSSGSFWVVLKNQPIVGEEIMIFKTMITFHKVIKDGHPQVLKDGLQEGYWLENLAKGTFQGNRGDLQHLESLFPGYSILIKSYVQFLQSKLAFHKIHPAFNGSFDYEEYVTLKGIEDPNEGYETIGELLDLLSKLDMFQKIVFTNLRTGTNNECKIAALVPLLEESHGIYQFLTSMITAMHQIIGSAEVLAPLRERYNASHYALFKFYYECTNIRYLTSLITIPKLSQDPVDFLSQPATKQPRPRAPVEDNSDYLEQERMIRKFEREMQEQDQLEKERLEKERLDQQRYLEQQRQAQLERHQSELLNQSELQRQQDLSRQQEEDRLRFLQMQQQQQQQQAFSQNQMESQMAQMRLGEMQRELDLLRNQSYRDKSNLEENHARMGSLENQLANMSARAEQAEQFRDLNATRLQEELNNWKQKYDALAKLYAQLRKEHLDLLTKFKEVRDSTTKVTDDSRREMDKLRNEFQPYDHKLFQIKGNEHANLLVERDRLKGESDRIRKQYEEEISRLRRELDSNSSNLSNISKSKGDELSSFMARSKAEKDMLESDYRAKQLIVDDLSRQLDNAKAQLQKYRSNNEESEVLQATLDQTLIALDRLQRNAKENEMELQSQIKRLEAEHMIQLNKMIDNILQACIQKVDDAIYEFDNAYETNPTASAEYALTLVEKVQYSCVDFAQSFVRLIQGGDQIEAINTSNSFTHTLVQLLQNAKGVIQIASNDDIVDEIMRTVKSGASSAKYFFLQMISVNLAKVDERSRPSFIITLCKQTQQTINTMAETFEKLVAKQVTLSVTNAEDIGAVVDREMKYATEAIMNAARKLDQLMGRGITVHSAILEAAKHLTNAISELIIRATESQQEIVAQGKGSTTTGAFYKKNNKWTEGLISAAKSVAIATTFLVECADGLINNTHSMEQLIVSAQEVSVATTQLVAASRVKSSQYSKTQDRLEKAAVSVRDATKQLVKAAKEASKRTAEQNVQAELLNLGPHQYKVVEMEQQVKILEIEKELTNARYKLAEIRKSGYANN